MNEEPNQSEKLEGFKSLSVSVSSLIGAIDMYVFADPERAAPPEVRAMFIAFYDVVAFILAMAVNGNLDEEHVKEYDDFIVQIRGLDESDDEPPEDDEPSTHGAGRKRLNRPKYGLD